MKTDQCHLIIIIIIITEIFRVA